jgi:exoribonuclease R
MLPRSLSERACSLTPAADRLCVSVLLRLRADGSLVTGDVTGGAGGNGAEGGDGAAGAGAGAGAAAGWRGGVWIGRSVVRVGCRLAYEHAQVGGL